jgi:SecD/SecF fusion protein
MNRRLRWKLVFIVVAILGTSAFAWLPPLAERVGLQLPRPLADRGLRLGLDLKGGVQFVLRVNAQEAISVDPTISQDDVVAQARQTVDRRINALGVVEPVIAVQGDDGDELLIQLPGFTDVDRARGVLGATARLEWRLVEGNTLGDIAVSGRDIQSARMVRDDYGQPAVGFTLTADGASRFADLTARNIGRQVAIVLDDEVQSSPFIESAITGGTGVIRGGFSLQEATDLALLLQAGALPASMTFLGGEYVGPTLGASAVRAGIVASLGGLALVVGFLLTYYRRAGVNAVISVVANLAILLGVMASLGAALTLPGIAGLILTIGMGVDSNVLIFERIKEERRAGQSMRRAIAAGFDRVFLTILDTHVASLIAAAFLFQFGDGAVRGFATTLSLGLLTNIFTALVVSRTMFELTTRGERTTTFGESWIERWLGRGTAAAELPALHGPAGGPPLLRLVVAALRCRRAALWLSAAVVVVSVTVITVRVLPLGLDFTGGTAVVASFEAPISEDSVRHVLPAGTTVQRYGEAPERTLQIRVPQSAIVTDGDDQASVRAITTALAGPSLPPSRIEKTTTVGPTFGRDRQRKGAYAMAGALSGIAAYVALRFRPGFAAGATIATLHDLVVTIAALSLAGYDVDLNIVAALLTVAGYSVNDTIVIFDRVRERLRSSARATMESAVSGAVIDTLGRTVITSGTTLAAVLSLYLYGGPVLAGFAFTVLVGIIVGTWSTVFIATPVAALVARR